ncbi:MAG: ankyrin repeat-containing domain protein [Olpidium bornovanus]|uniref:Ankyrin repeat-containing domain protein n=1 Tax=Olpidium bornovanus TaxID=278681 RepID=A0A8H8A1H9_9FUNG|nr:MAG: ankyrin repeat-containing domain protein [Olpidium bornovanus]
MPPPLTVAVSSRPIPRFSVPGDAQAASPSRPVEKDNVLSANLTPAKPSAVGGVGECTRYTTGVDKAGSDSDRQKDTVRLPTLSKKRRRLSHEPKSPSTSGVSSVPAEHPDRGSYASELLNYFRSGSVDVPRMLLNMPPDFDVNLVVDGEGHTALHCAAMLGNTRVVQVLVQQRANLGCVNVAGQTPLMRSVMFPNSHDNRMFTEVLELLHPTVFVRDCEGRTVLHHAVRLASANSRAARYYVECLVDRILLNYDELSPLVDAPDANGDTALTLAARFLDRRLVKLLLKAGGDPSVRNSEGMSADDYATEFLEQGYTVGGGGFCGVAGKDGSGPDAGAARQPEHHDPGAAARVLPLLQRYVGGAWNSGGGPAEDAGAAAPPARALPAGRGAAAVDAVAQTARKIAETGAQLDEVTRVLCRARDEAEDARRTIEALRPETELIPRLRDQVRELEADLRRTIHRNQRLKLRSLVHQLSEQIEREDQDRRDGPPPTGRRPGGGGDDDGGGAREDLLAEARSLRDALAALQHDRRDLVEEMVHLRSQAGGPRQTEYRRLIARCCDVDPDEVDGMIRSLLESVRSGGSGGGGDERKKIHHQDGMFAARGGTSTI